MTNEGILHALIWLVISALGFFTVWSMLLLTLERMTTTNPFV